MWNIIHASKFRGLSYLSYNIFYPFLTNFTLRIHSCSVALCINKLGVTFTVRLHCSTDGHTWFSPSARRRPSSSGEESHDTGNFLRHSPPPPPPLPSVPPVSTRGGVRQVGHGVTLEMHTCLGRAQKEINRVCVHIALLLQWYIIAEMKDIQSRANTLRASNNTLKWREPLFGFVSNEISHVNTSEFASLLCMLKLQTIASPAQRIK